MLLAPLITVATQICTDPSYYNSYLWVNDCVFDDTTVIQAYKGVGSQYQLYVDNIEDFSVCEIEVNGGCMNECRPGELINTSSMPAENPFYKSTDSRLLSKLQV